MSQVGLCLVAVARLAFQERHLIAEDRMLRQVAAELAGLCDVLDGMVLTDPEQRARAHLHRIDELAASFPDDERDEFPRGPLRES